jgi:glucose/arabinose dehydrogenase
LLLALLVGAAPTHAFMTTPAGFEDQPVAKVIAGTALAFTPDGRLLITRRDGFLYVYKNGRLQPTPALTFPSSKLCFNGERGLLGIAADPNFATNHEIYLYYTFNKFGDCATTDFNTPVNRVSRFVLSDSDIVDPASENVLIDNIPSPSGMHNAGDLQFGKDGLLYISAGDGACDFRGDSGCGPQNDAARDLTGLSGKILRITPSGSIPNSNPYRGGGTQRCNVDGSAPPPTKCQEIFSWGLRNPWRMAFDPNAAGTLFYINDVGLSKWEEVDLGTSAADYGWNLREGPCAVDSYTDCGPPPLGTTDPIYSYAHTNGCSSITGGAFVPAGAWSREYDDVYLYGDLVCGKIFKLVPNGIGGFTASDFATAAATNFIVSLTFGPQSEGQPLYYVTYGDGSTDQQEVRRIAFTGQANRAPVADASASPTHGPLPLNVDFDGRASFDPDNDPLTYEWNFGDGSPTRSGATVSHSYTSSGVYTATLTVNDGRGRQASDSVQIDAANDPPVPKIDAPLPNKLFRVGETIQLVGEATDPEDGPLPDSALTFEVIRRHDTHFHPFFPPTQGNNFSITGPGPEDINSTQNSYLEIILTATDPQGLSATVRQALRPHLVNMWFDTDPSSLRLQVAGSPITTPQNVVSWDGWAFGVDALDQSSATGTPYQFASWSDGGAASHTISTPSSSASYIASFTRAGYARPKSATPMGVRFVPAFQECTAENANGTHGEPLEGPSCGPPALQSESLTVDSPDSNGFPADAVGRATLKVFCTDGAVVPCSSTSGDTEDVAIDVSLTDVRCAASDVVCAAVSGSDYVGKLLLRTSLRITDRLNGTSGSAAGTVSDVPFEIPINCTATQDLMTGSTCDVNTTADALYPGLVHELARTVWELGEFELLDEGPNGTGYEDGCPPSCGDGDEQVFMRQGLFAP